DGRRDRNVTGVQTCALPILIIYSLKTFVAQILKFVAFFELTRYPTAIIISKLYIFTGFLELSTSVFPTVLFSLSSPLFNILLICSVIVLLPTSNNSAIKF